MDIRATTGFQADDERTPKDCWLVAPSGSILVLTLVKCPLNGASEDHWFDSPIFPSQFLQDLKNCQSTILLGQWIEVVPSKPVGAGWGFNDDGEVVLSLQALRSRRANTTRSAASNRWNRF